MLTPSACFGWPDGGIPEPESDTQVATWPVSRQPNLVKVRLVVDMAGCFMDNAPRLAGVMELVDVPDSKSGARDGVGVRVPPPAPDNAMHLRVNRTNVQRVIGTDTVVSYMFFTILKLEISQ
jgi:hypothetical protein